jgi:hypothetical protein
MRTAATFSRRDDATLVDVRVPGGKPELVQNHTEP